MADEPPLEYASETRQLSSDEARDAAGGGPPWWVVIAVVVLAVGFAIGFALR
ncbi:MAG: hypothetical protein KBG48_25950 [Kofleriaceae bacterium]|jgi:hypothetical protein|nr:hypothetical protein [Kofleriaceae bacterium]MBP9170867.1 hypothetical protein [Kofleriaceae bacterium]